jgi:hypothetical protein
MYTMELVVNSTVADGDENKLVEGTELDDPERRTASDGGRKEVNDPRTKSTVTEDVEVTTENTRLLKVNGYIYMCCILYVMLSFLSGTCIPVNKV